jgi:hypothetical protein
MRTLRSFSIHADTGNGFVRSCLAGTNRRERPWPHALHRVLRILSHSESHIVKLSDGSFWQIYPGDIDLTLGWLPTTDLRLFEINDHIASHGLINCEDSSCVPVRPVGERWPDAKVKHALKDG